MMTGRPSELGRNHPALGSFILYSPVLIGILMMLPRLASPQFGLFDDGQTITNAVQVLQGNWGVIFENAFGRTRPIYWLFYTLIFKIAGREPFWFFMVNLVVFVTTIVTLIALMRSLGASQWQAGITGLLFTLCGPIVENIYTLSKAELIQMTLMLAGMLIFAHLFKQASPLKHPGAMIAIGGITLLATLFKEVTLIGIGITAGWLVIGWLAPRVRLAPLIARRTGINPQVNPPEKSTLIPALWAYLIGQSLAGMAFLIIRGISSGSLMIQKTTTSYAAQFDLSLSKIASNFVHWSGWIIHDFPYLFIVILILLVWISTRRRIPQPSLLTGAIIWMAAWFVFYLPWRFIVEYYLLPFAIGCSIICGIILGKVIDDVWESSSTARIAGWAGLAISTFLFLVTLINNVTNARIQLNVDAANAAMLDYVATSTPKNGQVLLNLSPQSEYGNEIMMHLALIQNRPDLQVAFLNPKTLSAAQASHLPYLIVSPQLINQLILSVRMGVSEPDVSQANATLVAMLSGLKDARFPIIRQFNLRSIDITRIVCIVLPKLAYCSKNNSIFDQRLFAYGWYVDQAMTP